jgi:hypothetical protein
MLLLGAAVAAAAAVTAYDVTVRSQLTEAASPRRGCAIETAPRPSPGRTCSAARRLRHRRRAGRRAEAGAVRVPVPWSDTHSGAARQRTPVLDLHGDTGRDATAGRHAHGQHLPMAPSAPLEIRLDRPLANARRSLSEPGPAGRVDATGDHDTCSRCGSLPDLHLPHRHPRRHGAPTPFARPCRRLGKTEVRPRVRLVDVQGHGDAPVLAAGPPPPRRQHLDAGRETCLARGRGACWPPASRSRWPGSCTSAISSRLRARVRIRSFRGLPPPPGAETEGSAVTSNVVTPQRRHLRRRGRQGQAPRRVPRVRPPASSTPSRRNLWNGPHRAATTPVRMPPETYILSRRTQGDANVKVRDGLLDIKVKTGETVGGLRGLPAPRQVPVSRSSPEGHGYDPERRSSCGPCRRNSTGSTACTFDAFLGATRRQHGDLVAGHGREDALGLHHRRRHLRVRGGLFRTGPFVESALRRERAVPRGDEGPWSRASASRPDPNVSYLKALKRAVGLE